MDAPSGRSRSPFALSGMVAVGLLAGWAVLLSGCGDPEPDGLREARETGGPTVRYRPETRPFPDVPWPSDLLTREDRTSPTGRRLNLSEVASSESNARLRRAMNERTGWGLYQPVTIGFDAPLDVRNILDRHAEEVPDFEDDVAYLVNVDRESPEFGRMRLLDLGRDTFPVTHAEPGSFFPQDPRSDGSNLLFETAREVDENDNGFLDPVEDTDDDGRWDRPNTLDPEGAPRDPEQMLEFYERQTNTLILRPVEPLRPGTKYAVVLTKALRGADGAEVQSPFPAINHTRQTDALEPLREILPNEFPDRFQRDLEDVQFAWSFTTGTPTRTLRKIREGLYGEGPLARLAEDFPAELKLLHDAEGDEGEGPMTFEVEPVTEFIVPLLSDRTTDEGAAVIENSLQEVDYMVSGTFLSPYFLGDSDGLAEDGADSTLSDTNPQVTDERFRIDLADGTAETRAAEVPFLCSVPEADGAVHPPFPVVLYSHAISSTRLEMLLFAGLFARYGMATCAIDAAGHGLEVPEQFAGEIDNIAEGIGLPGLATIIKHHRARDVRNDGTPDPAGDYFTSDLLHSRSMIRQTAIDQMQFLRILRSLQGDRRWPAELDADDRYVEARQPYVAGWDQDGDGEGELRGDFNGDGTVDLGGSQGYAAFGTSLGALQTGLLGSLDPAIRVAATNAGGGGLADIATRTTIDHVHNSVLLRAFGPLVVGEPLERGEDGNSETLVSFILPDGSERTKVPFATVDVDDGDRIILRNLAREERSAVPPRDRFGRATVRDGSFRVSVAADAESATARRARLEFDANRDLRTDIMGCSEDDACGEASCPDAHHCADSGECVPLYQCQTDFDPEGLEEDEARSAYDRHTADRPREYGDALVLEVRAPSGEVKERIESFQFDAVYQNIRYPAGSGLAALDHGRGLQRQTPEFRRFIGRANMMLEVADPIVAAPHYVERPLEFPYESDGFRDGTTQLLAVGTVGDQTVPIDTGLAFGRAAGLLEIRERNPAYEKTANQYLVDRFVYEGIADFDRFANYPGALFDPDDLDRGQFVDPDNPDDADPNPDARFPLRSARDSAAGTSGLRLPYLETDGAHTFNAPRPTAPFDAASFMSNQVGWFFATAGAEIRDDPCLQERPPTDCRFYDPETFRGSALSTVD